MLALTRLREPLDHRRLMIGLASSRFAEGLDKSIEDLSDLP